MLFIRIASIFWFSKQQLRKFELTDKSGVDGVLLQKLMELILERQSADCCFSARKKILYFDQLAVPLPFNLICWHCRKGRKKQYLNESEPSLPNEVKETHFSCREGTCCLQTLGYLIDLIVWSSPVQHKWICKMSLHPKDFVDYRT